MARRAVNRAEVLLSAALQALDDIETSNVSNEVKTALLSRIYEAANKNIEKLADASVENVPLWADRDRTKKISPCDFVKLHYSSYGKGLTTSRIGDVTLRQALWTFKSKHGWPADFDLPGKSEAVDRLLSEVGPHLTLKGLTNLPPRVRRDRQRAWQARHDRSKNGGPSS